MNSRHAMFLGLVLTLLAGIAGPGGLLFAHHSNAKFDNENVTVMDGTVVDYRWRNPHVIVIWDSEKDGKVSRWYGDLASIPTSIADGLTKDSLKPGDKVRLSVYAAKAGTPEAVILYIEEPDGTVVLGWSTRGGGVPGARAARRSDRPSEQGK